MNCKCKRRLALREFPICVLIASNSVYLSQIAINSYHAEDTFISFSKFRPILAQFFLRPVAPSCFIFAFFLQVTIGLKGGRGTVVDEDTKELNTVLLVSSTKSFQ